MLDSAYQGYASGDLERDRRPIELFVEAGLEIFVCQSFAKNLGLYGERMGMIHVVTENAETARRVLSQIKMIVRPMYSSPPLHGALLVERVLGNADHFQQWKEELQVGGPPGGRGAAGGSTSSGGRRSRWEHQRQFFSSSRRRSSSRWEHHCPGRNSSLHCALLVEIFFDQTISIPSSGRRSSRFGSHQHVRPTEWAGVTQSTRR